MFGVKPFGCSSKKQEKSFRYFCDNNFPLSWSIFSIDFDAIPAILSIQLDCWSNKTSLPGNFLPFQNMLKTSLKEDSTMESMCNQCIRIKWGKIRATMKENLCHDSARADLPRVLSDTHSGKKRQKFWTSRLPVIISLSFFVLFEYIKNWYFYLPPKSGHI